MFKTKEIEEKNRIKVDIIFSMLVFSIYLVLSICLILKY